MDDNTFWTNVWKIIGTVICILALSAAGCTANRHYQTRILIENAKVSPLEATCALQADTIGNTACILRAIK